MLFVALVVFLGFCNFSSGDEIFVDFPLGTVKGKTRTTIDGVTVHSFQGIPYVEPVVNESRFQAAQPKEPWNGVLDATIERSYCLQVTYDYIDGDEDCLFINIFSPKDPKLNASLPVMIFIYGGGFIEGASVDVNYGPDHLLNYDVVFVTFNYRIGPFGFFSTGDDIVPGNAGLKDQVMALRFVNKYIQYFGGDPNKVTIFGQSAGAASVHYHVLSPLSKGLFRAAICESASALSPWAYQRNQTELSYLLGNILNPNFGTYNATSSEIYEYLRKLPSHEVDRAAHTIMKMEKPSDSQIQNGVFFGPVIEHEHEGAFITKSMYELLQNGEINDVKIMFGVASEEFLTAVTDPTFDNTAEEFTNDINLLIPRDMNVNESSRSIVAQKIKDFYSPYLDFNVNVRELIKYFSDQCFARSILKAAQLQSKWNDVYVYEFMFHGVLGGYTEESVVGFSNDVRHGEDISFTLRRNYGGLNTTDLSKYPEIDQIVQKRFITLFTNFAKYLNPTPEKTELLQNLEWPTVKPNDFQYLAIGSWLELRRNPKENMYIFWNQLFDQYGVPPFTSY